MCEKSLPLKVGPMVRLCRSKSATGVLQRPVSVPNFNQTRKYQTIDFKSVPNFTLLRDQKKQSIFDLTTQETSDCQYPVTTSEVVQYLKKLKNSIDMQRKGQQACQPLSTFDRTGCSICSKQLWLVKGFITRLPCKHQYHQKCLQRWQSSNKSKNCPNCRGW